MPAATGKMALAEALAELGKVPNPEEVAEALWPVFSTAARAAVAEVKAEELEGMRRWRAARNPTK